MSNIPPEIQTLLSTQQVVLGKPIGTFMKRSWKDALFKDETTPGKACFIDRGCCSSVSGIEIETSLTLQIVGTNSDLIPNLDKSFYKGNNTAGISI
jgi:hypothetical protein